MCVLRGPMLLRRWPVLTPLILSSALSARADAWTNLAGHVIQAALVGYENGQATLQLTNGTAMRIPLSALCEADQRRIRLRYNEPVAPDYALAAYRDASALLIRYGRLPPERKSPEEREKVVRQALAVFDQRIVSRGASRLDAAVRAEVDRLRDSLR